MDKVMISVAPVAATDKNIIPEKLLGMLLTVGGQVQQWCICMYGMNMVI